MNRSIYSFVHMRCTDTDLVIVVKIIVKGSDCRIWMKCTVAYRWSACFFDSMAYAYARSASEKETIDSSIAAEAHIVAVDVEYMECDHGC